MKSGRWLTRFALTLFLFHPAEEVRAADDPVGMILLVQGEGRLARGDAVTVLSLGDPLNVGDVIEIESGEVSMIFCPENSRMKVKAGTTLRVGVGNIEILGGGEPEILGSGACVLPRVVLGGESLERMGALRPRGSRPIVVYLGGKISTGRPLFEWMPVDGAEHYRIAIRNEAGRVLWEARSVEPRREFPRDLPPLAQGWYSWELVAEVRGTVLARQDTGFEVIEAEGTWSEAGGGEDEMLLKAFELEEHGYHAESAALLRDLERRGQASHRLSRRLAWLYWSAGLLPAFHREMERVGDPDPE